MDKVGKKLEDLRRVPFIPGKPVVTPSGVPSPKTPVPPINFKWTF